MNANYPYKGTTMPETQSTISAWAEQTFGPVSSNARVATIALEEMVELVRKLTVDDSHHGAAEEAADVVIVLYRLANLNGESLIDMAKDYGYLFTSMGKANAEIAADAGIVLFQAVGRLIAQDSPLPWIALAQVVYALDRLASRLGSTLQAEIDKKMQINRQRDWKLDGTVHGYHVRDKAA